MENKSNSIVDVAINAGTFKTLVTALQTAGLANTLSGDGPFTVFAPTDEAFGKLPKGTVEDLLNNIPKLKSILLYHVVSGEVKAADVMKITSAKTLQGGTLKIDTSLGAMVDKAKVIKTDIMASNGVIHVIDAVLMPM